MAKVCACGCGVEFSPLRADGRFASTACRVRWNRAQKKAGAVRTPGVVRLVTTPAAVAATSVEEATRAELGEQVGTVLGQSALVLAKRLDSGQDPSGSAVAALVKQLAALMASRPVELGASEEDPVAKARRAVADIRTRHLAGA